MRRSAGGPELRPGLRRWALWLCGREGYLVTPSRSIYTLKILVLLRHLSVGLLSACSPHRTKMSAEEEKKEEPTKVAAAAEVRAPHSPKKLLRTISKHTACGRDCRLPVALMS